MSITLPGHRFPYWSDPGENQSPPELVIGAGFSTPQVRLPVQLATHYAKKQNEIEKALNIATGFDFKPDEAGRYNPDDLYCWAGRCVEELIKVPGATPDLAQEMDQTTYRIFVRWIHAIARLHVARKIPLSTVVFLHQEDRTLDLARATNLSVVMIEWAAHMRTDGPNPTVKTLQLNNSDFKWPIPEPLRMA